MEREVLNPKRIFLERWYKTKVSIAVQEQYFLVGDKIERENPRSGIDIGKKVKDQLQLQT